MKKRTMTIFIFSLLIKTTLSYDTRWAIIGAGPAGLCVAGLLIDLGVPGEDITMIDPEFNVGRLGKSYGNVPSNTQTKYFVEFINSCKAFQASNSEHIKKLYEYDPEKEYSLQIIIDPLLDITRYLATQINTLVDTLQSLDFKDDTWYVGTTQKVVSAYNVVLATGSHPRVLHYPTGATQIPLDTALDKSLLAELVTKDDSIAVIGSAHSAMLILKYLSELSVKRILNFYSRPLQYAIPNPSGLINEENGLKGVTAHWALEVLEKNPPANLIRLFNCKEALDTWLPLCTKIIYAVGYERNELPTLNGTQRPYDCYDSSSGIIAQRLFGIGIAFPERIADFNGTPQFGIGLNNFIEYAQKVLPTWMQKKCNRFAHFNSLFMITAL